MMSLCFDVLTALAGRSLVTAESCTGGGIGAALTAVPGSSAVFKGGIISYTDWVKEHCLGVDRLLLAEQGAVSAAVAEAMAVGAKAYLQADVAVSVTGLAGPDGDGFGNPVGTVYIGFADCAGSEAVKFHFCGDRQQVRQQAIEAALRFLLNKLS